MSLIAWWPLNDNTNNYGTLGAEIQATASGATFTDGKIGKALYKGSLTLTGEQWKKIIGNTISIAMWIYTRNDGSYSAGTPFFGNGGMTKPNNRKFTMFHYNTKTNLHCSWQNDDSNSTYWSCHYTNFFELNKWVHLCIVQDAATNTVTVYRNGEQYSRSTVSGLSSMNFKEAGTAPIRNNINYQHMNDLRIYDHALSQAEVKELSRALVVHYTFDDSVLTTYPQLLQNEASLIQSTYNTNLTLVQDSASGTFSLSCTGNTMINTPVTGDITAGATISCWIKVPTYPSANAIVFADYNSKLSFGFYGTQNAIISCGGYSAPYISNIKGSWINGWNHVVVTRNSGGTISCYLNGVKLSTTGSNNWSSTSGYSTIGGRYNGSYTTYFTGYVDDYRVYHTLLSDTDIQDLYKTKAYITDKGDIETHQFIEGKTQAQVTHKYTFECKETQEKPNIPGFELLDGILIEKNPYFDTGLVFSDVNTSIYVDAEVTPTNTSGNNCLAGSGNSGWNGPIMLNFCGGKMEFGTSGYSTSTEPQGKFAANERLTVQAEIYPTTQKWYKNNVQINNITQRTRTATTATFAIGTFKTPSGTVGATHSFKGYIHRFYIKYGDEVRCYLPAKRKADSVYGLYDIHTKTFLVNSGGGSVSGTVSTLCDEAAIYHNGHISGREIIEI